MSQIFDMSTRYYGVHGYSTIIFKAYLLLVAINLSDSQVHGTQQQSVTFFKEQDCLGNNYFATVYDTTNLTADLGSALSFYVNGIWRMDFCGPGVPGPTGCKRNIFIYEGACNSRVSNVNYNFTYLERYGNEFQNDSEIVLFSENNFGGKSYRSNRYGLDLISPDTIKSWYFTGNSDWTVYSGVNCTGTKNCLKPNNITINRGYGVTYSRMDTRTVSSILFSCNGTGSIPTTTTTIITSPSITSPSITSPSITSPSITSPSITSPSITSPSPSSSANYLQSSLHVLSLILPIWFCKSQFIANC